MCVSESATSGIVSVRQKWSENFGQRRYCLSEASFVSAEIRVTYIFGNDRHTVGDFSLVSFLLVMQKKRKVYSIASLIIWCGCPDGIMVPFAGTVDMYASLF